MALDPLKTLETALKINRPAAVLVTGGFLLLAVAAALGNHFKDSGLTFWHIPLALLGFSILVAIFGRRRRAMWAAYGHPYGPWAHAQAARSAESTLAERYAQGDIDEKEYRARLEVLRASAPQPPIK